MEFLAPSYQVLLQIRQNMQAGTAVSEAIRGALSGSSSFHWALRRWWLAKQRGAKTNFAYEFKAPLQKILIETLERGLAGEPILTNLNEIEEEMRLAMNDTIERHLQRLPVILLLPLAGLIFPSFMLLILGPLLSELLRSLQ
ncbi:MAG: hypothetical protein AB7N80_06025 [Bdellovibrionales bacterium]